MISTIVKRVFVVDDHPIVFEGLKQMLQKEKDIQICGTAEDSDSAMKAISRIKPELVLLDISLKGGDNGLEIIKALKRTHPKIIILVLSMHDESLYAERVIRAGARGYVMKNEFTTKIIYALREVINGNIYLSKNMSERLLNNLVCNQSAKITSSIEKLSNRELEILQLIGSGYKSSHIAKKLNISIKTIETHRMRIKEKLSLENSNELMKYAIEWSYSCRST